MLGIHIKSDYRKLRSQRIKTNNPPAEVGQLHPPKVGCNDQPPRVRDKSFLWKALAFDHSNRHQMLK